MSVLHEDREFMPCENFVANANISTEAQYQKLLEKFSRDYSGTWENLAKKYLSWHKEFTIGLNQSQAPFVKWFEDGLMNVSYNCIDRHAETTPHKTAMIFESDAGHVETITYKELLAKVCKMSNGLRSIGVTKGDRVIIYLPNSIEAVIAMQACNRIGAIHSVVFGGFSAKAVNDRIIDAKAKIIITADAQKRAGKVLALKDDINEALSLGGCESIEHVIVHRRTGDFKPLTPGRDIWWYELVANQDDYCEPEWVDSEHPLFILYTSGSTGKPKGVQHSSAGYLLGTMLTLEWVFDAKPTDVFWCTADVGWITGHSYLCYGPLAKGLTQVVFEGVPTYPDASRFWKMIETHRVTTFYTAPTAIRSLIKLGGDLPRQYDLSSLRLLGSVGEPINPEAWIWYYNEVGGGRCPIVDTWWQTETGCNILAPIPGITKMKPGSCTRPIPGIDIDIVDDVGNSLPNNSGGYLVIKKPFPSQIRNIWGDSARYVSSYFPSDIADGKYYVAGDSAHKDSDSFFWILGRIDDVLNVSGHRMGTMEVESALVSHPMVAEAAVVGKAHEIKGEAIVAFVTLKSTVNGHEAKVVLMKSLNDWISEEIGPIAKCDEVRFVEMLPKTRSGKIMRRLLRSIARNEPITQDLSTLDNPDIIDDLINSKL